jgi:hypothetical protein
LSEHVLQQLRSGVSDFRLIADISRSGHRHAEPDDPCHFVERSQMLPRDSEDIGTGSLMPSSINRAARHRPAESLRRLPFANVRTAVYVQHLPGDVTGFRQINDTLSDVLRVGDRTHR